MPDLSRAMLDNRLIVELPGVTDLNKAIAL
jgi:hypothetical protein